MIDNQLTLSNKTLKEEENSKREGFRIEFLKEELNRLKEILKIVSLGEGIIKIDGAEIIFKEGNPINITLKEGWWERKKFLGEWWYCNHIKGWNNDLPIRDKDIINKYDDVPENDLMSNCIRNCFISVDRDGVRWDRKYCIERLKQAIKSYEELLEK